MIQQVVGLIEKLAPEIQLEYPRSVEVHNWHGQSWRFPRIRIASANAMDKLLDKLAVWICTQGLDGFPIARQPAEKREAVQCYISKPSLSPEQVSAVEGSTFWRDAVINAILLLRGLIAGGVLRFAFGQKRWRVNFGVDRNRDPGTLLAVPFRAKDEPAQRSEFSHPDVVIVLTCLSYYYGGLADRDIFDALSHLKQDDQAEPEYQMWVASAPNLPTAFRNLIGVNLRDRAQCIRDIFPHL